MSRVLLDPTLFQLSFPKCNQIKSHWCDWIKVDFFHFFCFEWAVSTQFFLHWACLELLGSSWVPLLNQPLIRAPTITVLFHCQGGSNGTTAAVKLATTSSLLNQFFFSFAFASKTLPPPLPDASIESPRTAGRETIGLFRLSIRFSGRSSSVCVAMMLRFPRQPDGPHPRRWITKRSCTNNQVDDVSFVSRYSTALAVVNGTKSPLLIIATSWDPMQKNGFKWKCSLLHRLFCSGKPPERFRALLLLVIDSPHKVQQIDEPRLAQTQIDQRR